MKNIPILLIILAVGLGCGSSPSNNPSNAVTSPNSATGPDNSPAVKTEVAPIVVSSRDLVKAYKENELAADEKYQGKKLQVSGKISNIATVLGSIQVDLEGRDFVSVKCSFPEGRKAEVAKLKTGQNAILLGTGDGMTAGLYVGMEDCSVK